MSDITIRIEDHTPELMQKLTSQLGDFVITGARYIEGQVKAAMLTAKHGRRYGTHTASAPGEAPADDTGNLVSSIDVLERSSLEAVIGTPVEYSRYLEEGTSRMAARPMWDKTARDSVPTLEKLLASAVARARS